jgi:hypothetical protein
MTEALAPDSAPSPKGPGAEGLVSEGFASEDAVASKTVILPKASRNLDLAEDSRLLQVLRDNAREQKEATRLVREVLSLLMSAATMRAKRERYWLILLTAQIFLAVVLVISIGYLVLTKDL